MPLVWVVVWQFRSWEERVRVYASEAAARAAVIAAIELDQAQIGEGPALTFDVAVAAWRDAGHSVSVFGPEPIQAP